MITWRARQTCALATRAAGAPSPRRCRGTRAPRRSPRVEPYGGRATRGRASSTRRAPPPRAGGCGARSRAGSTSKRAAISCSAASGPSASDSKMSRRTGLPSASSGCNVTRTLPDEWAARQAAEVEARDRQADERVRVRPARRLPGGCARGDHQRNQVPLPRGCTCRAAGADVQLARRASRSAAGSAIVSASQPSHQRATRRRPAARRRARQVVEAHAASDDEHALVAERRRERAPHREVLGCIEPARLSRRAAR